MSYYYQRSGITLSSTSLKTEGVKTALPVTKSGCNIGVRILYPTHNQGGGEILPEEILGIETGTNESRGYLM